MTAALLVEDKRVGEVEASPVCCYVCEKKIKDVNEAYHVSEDLWRHINCDPVGRSKPKTEAAPKESFKWWYVKGRQFKNLRLIKDAFSSHEHTLRAYGITVDNFDVEAVNDLVGDVRCTIDILERYINRAVHYYVTALVKIDKARRGKWVDWDMEGCRDFENYVEFAREKWKLLEKSKRESEQKEDVENGEQRDRHNESDSGEANPESLRFETVHIGTLET